MTQTTLALLMEHPFLAGMATTWLERLSSYGHPAYRPPGFRLFHEDRPADRFWLLRSGRVALDIHVAGRGDVVIETISAGSVVGWSWLFPPYRWHFGAVATEPMHAVEFGAAGVRRLRDEDAELARDLDQRFMMIMLDRLQAARGRLAELYGYPPS
ncbi:Crp/Fnr family transcriptional regulator [Krasilnikovia sp. M28-CT-15]|uniref:Crp/Fnr family transcriptional regulator n=1 Tax=Krasilnikovia sp. M28-CT-15 TaxID=3373540 RepID=UPI003875EA1D